jgi:hypothetical protein
MKALKIKRGELIRAAEETARKEMQENAEMQENLEA